MSWLPERRCPPGPRPCVGSEMMRELLTDEGTAHVLATGSAADREPGATSLDRKEWFGAHVMIFLIGVWNLFAIDLAHTPGKWWFWLPAVAWAAIVVVHAAWLFRRGRWTVQCAAAISRGEAAR